MVSPGKQSPSSFEADVLLVELWALLFSLSGLELELELGEVEALEFVSEALEALEASRLIWSSWE